MEIEKEAVGAKLKGKALGQATEMGLDKCVLIEPLYGDFLALVKGEVEAGNGKLGDLSELTWLKAQACLRTDDGKPFFGSAKAVRNLPLHLGMELTALMDDWLIRHNQEVNAQDDGEGQADPKAETTDSNSISS